MLVGTQQRKKRNSTKVNLLISTTFHGILVGLLLYLAAREGWLGKKAEKFITVSIEKKEKPPEKPKELPKPKEDAPKPVEPKTDVAKITPKYTPPPEAVSTAPATVAPPAAEQQDFVFEGGKEVITANDPKELYKSMMQRVFLYHWSRPTDVDDHSNIAEVEITVDKKGNVTDPVWKKHSGQPNWDQTVDLAIRNTPKITEPPPSNFPPRVVIRFDVAEQDSGLQ